MKRRFIAGTGHEHLLCVYRECRGKTVSSTFEAVDEAVLASFRYRIKHLQELKRNGVKEVQNEPDKKAPLEAELTKAKRQLSRMYDLLEQEIYDTNVFLERSKVINDKIKKLEDAIKEITDEPKLPQLSPDEAIERLQYIIDNFNSSDSEEKNRLLHSVVRKIYYNKTIRMCKNKQDSDLSLNVDFL